MAVGYKLPDGRDFDDVFTQQGNSLNVGYKMSNGADIGTRYLSISGSPAGIVTGYKNSAGTDLGSIFSKARFVGTVTNTTVEDSANCSETGDETGPISALWVDLSNAGLTYEGKTVLGLSSAHAYCRCVDGHSYCYKYRGFFLKLARGVGYSEYYTLNINGVNYTFRDADGYYNSAWLAVPGVDFPFSVGQQVAVM